MLNLLINSLWVFCLCYALLEFVFYGVERELIHYWKENDII